MIEFFYVPGIVLVSVAVIGGARQRGNEKRSWNNGVCSESGKPWKCFDVDSQGGRGYSDGCGHATWISYAVDRIASMPDHNADSKTTEDAV